MSDTPETDAIVRNAATADHPPTRLAATLTVKCEKLERERDEAREELRTAVQERHDFHWQLLDAVRERDEARDIGEKLSKQGLEMMDENRTLKRERDEALEKYDLQAVENMLAVNKICHERDEARGELARIESLLLDPHAVFLNLLRGKIAKLDWANLEHIHGPHPARVERDEARESLEEEKKFHHRTHRELVQTQCKVLDFTQAIIITLEENRHLADGDDCTLAKLKSAVSDWK